MVEKMTKMILMVIMITEMMMMEMSDDDYDDHDETMMTKSGRADQRESCTTHLCFRIWNQIAWQGLLRLVLKCRSLKH